MTADSLIGQEISQEIKKLSDFLPLLKKGEELIVHGIAVDESLDVDRAIEGRLLDFGFLPGETAVYRGRSIWGSPIWLEIGETKIALRSQEVDHLLVRRLA